MSFNDFHFIRPVWFLALFPYLVVLGLMLRKKLSQGNWAAVCDADLLPYLLQEKAARQGRWPLALGSIAALLAIIAMAGPSWQRLPSPVFRNDSALVIGLDLSRSMDVEDIKPSRLIRARYKIADILKHRKDGQTALLVYAGDAFTVTPLTDDTETIASQLEALTTDIMPSQGINTVAVLNKAVELFRQAGLQKGQIILVTDGVENKALASAKSLGNFSLSILGVGTADGAPIALPDGGFMKDEKGTIVIPKLNAGELAELARAGHGIYQTLTTDDADIQALLANLDSSEYLRQGDKDKQLVFELWEDKGPWLALLVLPLAALSFRKGMLCVALVLLLPLPKTAYALEWRDLWQTRDQQAATAFQNEQFDQAAKLFENPDWKAAAQYKANHQELSEMKTPKTATGFYNQGNVLAKSNRLEEAVKAYENALTIDPNMEDAIYNKEVVEKELEKRKKTQEQQQQNDSKQQESKDSSQENQPDDSSKQSGEEIKSEDKAQEQPSEQKNSQNMEQQSDAELEKAGTEEERPSDQRNQDKKQQSADQQFDPALSDTQPEDETTQANEQWLKRIPDDPAGLLKRKFKYQYGQRQPPSNAEGQNW